MYNYFNFKRSSTYYIYNCNYEKVLSWAPAIGCKGYTIAKENT